MKEFDTAVRVAEREDEEQEDFLEWEIVERDDSGEEIRRVPCRAFPPGDGQLAMMMAGLGRHTNDQTRVASIVDFFVGVMDEPTHTYVVDRLLDRKDKFGLAEIDSILMWLVEEWSGRPTERPSVSTPSRRTGGPKSTRRTSKSTSSV
jgi:hypothetical protein